jgi:hypothetical protein
MSLGTKLRRILLALMILASFTASFISFYTNRMWGLMEGRGDDPLPEFERRMACLKDLLPKRGFAGYVSDRSPIEFVYAANAVLPLIIEVKQYEFPPHIVPDTGKEYDFVIENTADTQNPMFINARYEIIADCFNGVRLFRKIY